MCSMTRIDHQGVVDPDLPNLGDGHQVGMLEVLRSFQARDDLIRIRKRLGQADGGWDVVADLTVSVSNHALRPSDRTRRRKG